MELLNTHVYFQNYFILLGYQHVPLVGWKDEKDQFSTPYFIEVEEHIHRQLYKREETHMYSRETNHQLVEANTKDGHSFTPY